MRSPGVEEIVAHSQLDRKDAEIEVEVACPKRRGMSAHGGTTLAEQLM